MKRKRLRAVVIISVITTFTVASIFIILNIVRTNNNALEKGVVSVEDGPCTSKAPDSVLSKAVKIFSADQINPAADDLDNARKQFELEKEITALPDYRKDLNCLHILAMVNINRTDRLKSIEYVDLLEEGLRVSSPPSYVLDENPNFLSISDMRRSIEVILLNEQQRQENDPLKGQDRSSERIDE